MMLNTADLNRFYVIDIFRVTGGTNHAGIAQKTDVIEQVEFRRGHVTVLPFVDFIMAIGEGEAGGIAVSPRGRIQPSSLVGLQVDEGVEVRVVNANLVFINEKIHLCWTWCGEVAEFDHKPERRNVSLVEHGASAHGDADRIAAVSRHHSSSGLERGRVAGAFEDTRRSEIAVSRAGLEKRLGIRS